MSGVIPKVVNWSFTGWWEMSELNKMCHESWKNILVPDGYEIIYVDPRGIPTTPWYEESLRLKTHNAIGYTKAKTLYDHGGVWLENDVEALRPFDLNQKCFIAFQRDDEYASCINFSVIGCVPGHWLVKEYMDRIQAICPNGEPLAFGPALMTEILVAHGLGKINEEQTVEDVMVYSKDRFYPWRWDEKPDWSRVTDRTFAIHHWEASWLKHKSA